MGVRWLKWWYVLTNHVNISVHMDVHAEHKLSRTRWRGSKSLWNGWGQTSRRRGGILAACKWRSQGTFSSLMQSFEKYYFSQICDFERASAVENLDSTEFRFQIMSTIQNQWCGEWAKSPNGKLAFFTDESLSNCLIGWCDQMTVIFIGQGIFQSLSQCRNCIGIRCGLCVRSILPQKERSSRGLTK